MNRKNHMKKLSCMLLIFLVACACMLWLGDQAPIYAASASTAVESLTLQAKPITSKPSVWAMAWRVGTTQVSTVNIGVNVTPQGTNVLNPRLTYYVKAVGKKLVYGDSVAVSLGSQFSNSTGAVSIDTHLSSLGLSTTSDQTVTYYLYAKLEATGAISGQTLSAEIPETAFSTVTYDYGGISTQTVTWQVTQDAYVTNSAPNTNLGNYPDLVVGDSYYTNKIYLFFGYSMPENVTAMTLKLYRRYNGATSGNIRIYAVQNAWVESAITWNNQPSLTSNYKQYYIGTASNQYYSFDVLGLQGTTNGYTNLCVSPSGTTDLLFSSKEYGSNPPQLEVTYISVNWAMSWAWANQPLSLIAVPVARLMVAVVLAGFGVLLLASKRRKRRAVTILGLAFLAAALLVGAGMASAKTVPMPIPDQWRSGDLAVYLQSFPFAATEVKDGVVMEQPATVEGDLTLNMAVFNATAENPVCISIDGEVYDNIEGEGFYTLTYTLPTGSHSVTVACPTKILEQAVFYVKPKPVTPMMPLEEFMRRLDQQRTEIVTRMLAAAAAAIPVGIYAKKRTLKHTVWFYPLPAACMAAGYVWMPDAYMLLSFGVALAVAYAVCPEFTRKHIVLVTMRNSLSEIAKIVLRGIDVDPATGDAVLEISPRHWRRGFIHKVPVKLSEPVTRTIEVDGELRQGYIAKNVEIKPEAVEITGDKATAYILEKGADAVDALATQNADLHLRNMLAEHALPALVADGISAVDRQTRTQLEQSTSIDKFLRRLNKQSDQQPEYAEGSQNTNVGGGNAEANQQ